MAAPAFSATVPLPPPRPADLDDAPPPAGALAYAPAPEREKTTAPAPITGQAGDPCAELFASRAAIAARVDPISGPGACGIAAPVRIKAVVLAGGRQIPLSPEPVLRCDMAAELIEWLIEDVAPLFEKGARRIARITNAAAYDCRGRNRQAFARLSEHAFGNAIDMRAIEMSDGARIAFVGGPDMGQTQALRVSACARFSTILGPGSDGYHEDHVHVDLHKRRRDVSICRWNIR